MRIKHRMPLKNKMSKPLFYITSILKCHTLSIMLQLYTEGFSCVFKYIFYYCSLSLLSARIQPGNKKPVYNFQTQRTIIEGIGFTYDRRVVKPNRGHEDIQEICQRRKPLPPLEVVSRASSAQ